MHIIPANFWQGVNGKVFKESMTKIIYNYINFLTVEGEKLGLLGYRK
ncbi:MAG: hypothetical protein Q7K42_00365 [Candidatus Diapherotrites archaeon]|nr:hypothetical protein [Candidatus Diapherotrites archaeon]